MAEFFVGVYGDYRRVVTDISSTLTKYIEENSADYVYPWDFVKDLKQYAEVTQFDVCVALSLALVLTLVRYALTAYIFLPMAAWLRLTRLNLMKFPESAWKTLYYAGTWSFSSYLLFLSGKYNYFSKTKDIWSDWSPGTEIPLDIYVLYMIQLGFYVHSLYATLYMDHWRKDSCVMLFHHIVSALLLIFSYATRYYKVGLLVLFLHDISDVLLESTKCNVYMKNRGGIYHPLNDHLATVGFVAFTSVWFWFRLYWFPTKVLHSAGHYSRLFGPEEGQLPFYMIFNVLLWIILTLNLYWFMFILNLLYRVATGQMKEIDDVREEEVIEQITERNGHAGLVSNGSTGNGVAFKKGKKMKKSD